MAGSRRSGGRVSPELAAVGERLRQAREAAGQSLEDIEAVTRIRTTYLEAIDDGRRAELPGDVFVKGFLRAYANAVGLEGDRLVAQYKRSLEGAAPDGSAGSGSGTTPAQPPPPTAPTRPRKAPESSRRVRAHRAGTPRPRQRNAQDRADAVRAARARIRARRLGPPAVRRDLLRWVVAGLAIVAVGWASYALAGHFAGHRAAAGKSHPNAHSTTHPSTEPAAATKHPLAVPHVAPARTSVQVHFTHQTTGWHGTYLVASAAGGLVVRITTDQRCWTSRWTDGSTRAQSVTLPAGGTTTWKARRTLRVEVANAPGVRSLTVNGQSTPALPREGVHVEWLTFRVATATAG